MAHASPLNASPQEMGAASVCLGCGCHCDDIALTWDGSRLVSAERACELGKRWFFTPIPESGPSAWLAGAPIDIDQAVRKASEILRGSKRPLVYGLGYSTCDAVRAAAEVAHAVGGVADLAVPPTVRSVRQAMQNVGLVTCTLGEVRQRADVVVFWGCDPRNTHPRHFERYSRQPASPFLPGGAADRTVVFVGPAQALSEIRAAESQSSMEGTVRFVELPADREYDALACLRAVIGGILPEKMSLLASLAPTTFSSEVTAAIFDGWSELALLMRQARYGVLFFDDIQLESAESLFLMVRDLNAHTAFAAMGLGGAGNPHGAENALTWLTGFPFAVDFSGGNAAFDPIAFDGEQMLADGSADALLWVGPKLRELLSTAALKRLEDIPVIEISSDLPRGGSRQAVEIQTSRTGFSSAGMITRVDDVPLPLRPFLKSAFPSEAEVLTHLASAIANQAPAIANQAPAAEKKARG